MIPNSKSEANNPCKMCFLKKEKRKGFTLLVNFVSTALKLHTTLLTFCSHWV